MKMDETDEKILKNLMVDARLSARQLALKLGMSTVTVLSRIKKLEKEKIIHGYTTIIDHEKLGYVLTAIIEIIAKNDKIEDIENKISKFENVCGVYDIEKMVVFHHFFNVKLYMKSLSTLTSRIHLLSDFLCIG